MTERAPSAPSGDDKRWAGAFRFIFAAAVINAVSFGIMIPVLPNLIKEFTGGDTAAASEWNVVFGAVWGVMQLFCGPILGMMSDRYGRRPILLVSLGGLAIDFLFMALAPSLMWLFVGRVINGLTAASFSTANAYVADVTPPDKRAKAYGWMGSAFSFGFLVGPALGGFLGDIDLRLPFFVAAALTTVNWLYGFFILPESLPPEKRVAKLDWKRANPVGSLSFLRSHNELLGLASIGFLFQLAHTVLPAIFVLYTGYRYGWTPGFMGLTMMATGLAGVIVQTLLVGPVVAKIGERGALLLGAAAGAAGFGIYGMAQTGWAYMLGVPVFALMNFLMPGLQGLMTRRVEPSAQGQLQGANQALQGIASVIGPVIFGMTFAWSIRHDGVMHQPGLAIYLASALLIGALLLSLRVGRVPKAAAAGA
ncbi:DHA1 family tetracycline resistance protein-like MFS transporter [Phenylobacterium haematophilum]|uniref:DHA1 family tetracycline resistance protein-like MFS transporter n=1 Tax=Phenylobacterium haematophilum TaxID=98513 RepID=A0A840A6G8_9CAUL|nr:TCR/Tet family MFS transporter [Phenylobacterium haematophilum]MBB3893579.1 DHA1 family tetracycline resistance protein-like MFS transporter [Phenylobacterium haematophilum]